MKERRGGRAHDCFSFSLLELIALSRGPANLGGDQQCRRREIWALGSKGFGIWFSGESHGEMSGCFAAGGGRVDRCSSYSVER